jgi:hypothetical protein
MTDWTSLRYAVADVEGNGQQPPDLVELAVLPITDGVMEAQMRLRPFSSRERGMFISIDGPGGAGRSTIVRHLAQMEAVLPEVMLHPSWSPCCADRGGFG